jgi:hypothetical protein
MKPRTLALISAMILFVALTISIQTFAQNTQDQIITFDAAPDARTYPTSINPSGMITGNYFDAKGLLHGFVRDRDGTITTFDGPGAGLFGTTPTGINLRGEITGYFYDASNVAHGFLRDRGGTITAFDAGPNGTFATSINPSGEIAGYYSDASDSRLRRYPGKPSLRSTLS